jgi:hypothetical protein
VDPRQRLEELRAARDPVFALADIRVQSSSGPHERVVNAILGALGARAGQQAASAAGAPSAP